ncbi:MAG: hypothetical protein FHP94_20495 [Denitromonas halophila]|nr:MAG: hypothetical protein FHP94_20495 [Denitromonas halophila]TVT66254.1 MAG: hypothetical protein FHP93_19140 [Denitromonas halophila]
MRIRSSVLRVLSALWVALLLLPYADVSAAPLAGVFQHYVVVENKSGTNATDLHLTSGRPIVVEPVGTSPHAIIVHPQQHLNPTGVSTPSFAEMGFETIGAGQQITVGQSVQVVWQTLALTGAIAGGYWTEPDPGNPGKTRKIAGSEFDDQNLKVVNMGQVRSKAALSNGQSLHFDSATSALSFSNDFITGTGFLGDLLIGAEVSPPRLTLTATDSVLQTALFRPTGDEPFRIHFGTDDVLQASLSQMRYDAATNMLVAELFDVVLSSVPGDSVFFDAGLAPFTSPWLDDIATILDPSSAEFLAGTTLRLSYIPAGDLWDATSGFTQAADTEISNFVQAVLVVSEPSAASLVAGTLILMCLLRVRRNPSGAGSGCQGSPMS